MAFRSMATGADCSTGSNPLSQITKQFTDDRSIQKDTLIPNTERAGPSLFRTARPDASFQENKFAEDFFSQRDHARLQGPVSVPYQEWTTEFKNMPDHPQLWKLESAEEAEMEEAFKRMNIHSGWSSEFLHGPDFPINQITDMPPEFEEAFQKNFDWADEYVLKQDKGKNKEKIVELDNLSWEEQFTAAQLDAESENLDNDLKLFENVWSSYNSEHLDPKVLESEFGDYIFEPNNPYLKHENPFQEGLRLMEKGGSLSEAALAFEAAVQKDEKISDAWTWLGNTQAQNEKEEAAIRALKKAVEVNRNNLTALMSLAVSYTNEGCDHQAYLTLERWLIAKYPEISISNAPMHGVIDTHTRVTDLFLQAARSAPEGQEMDPDVQVGLGVLFYGNSEYDKAVDCFLTALNTRKDDYSLWNRLGATLANSGRSEDAIEAYHKALDFKPTFVRARYNLGVSCLNIGCYHEAAEHLLGALSMHQTGNGDIGVNTSNSLRETLNRTFLMMEREDLADKILSGSDINQFREEFEF